MSDGFGHGTQRPMRSVRWRRLQRDADRFGDLIISDLARRAGARFVIKTVKAIGGEPPTPFADRILAGFHLFANCLVLDAVRSRKNNPRTSCKSLSGLLRS